MKDWVLNEEQAEKIIKTSPLKIKKSKLLDYSCLPEKKQIEHAKQILEKRRKTENGKVDEDFGNIRLGKN